MPPLIPKGDDIMNKYIFNWNAVIDHCPEYQRYLVDIRSLKDDEEEVIPEIETFGGAVHRTKEELDIIQQMNDSALQPTGRDIHGRVLRKTASPRENIIRYTLNPVHENQPLPVKMNPLQLMPPKCVLGVGSKMYLPGKTGWHICYQISSNEYTGKSVDMVKIKVNETEDKIQLVTARYWFDQSRDIVSERKGKFKCLTYNKKTHNLYYVFRVSKRKAGSKVVRYKSNVQGILLNTAQLNAATTSINKTILKSFVDLVEKAVLKDVPDAYVPTFRPTKLRTNRVGYRVVVDTRLIEKEEFLRTKLLVLILQHKANARLDWLNSKVVSNISKLVSIEGFEEQMDGINKLLGIPYQEQAKYYKNEHKRRVSKIVPALRASKSLKGLIKAVCGKYYAKILVKLMSTVDINSQRWVSVIKILHYERMPKFLYHWLSNVMKNDITAGAETGEVVILRAIDSLRDIDTQDEQERNRNLNILELWVKASKRFLEQGGPIPTWFTWRDMYNMANRMNIRLRPNKLKCVADVHHQHDLLSELTNRDRHMLQNYADVTFREFTIPDEEYDGFTFIQLRDAKELVHEGKTMHHCVGGYAPQCVRGDSIILSMRKGDRGYITIELDGASLPYSMRQKYTIDDVSVSNESVLKTINNWIEAVNKIHGDDKITYAQECKTISDTLKAEGRLENLTKLKEEADGDILTHINDECIELEQRLATLAIETTQTPPPNTTEEMHLLINDLRNAIDNIGDA